MRSYLFAALVLLAAVSCRRKDDETARLADTAPRLIAAYGIDTTLRAPADTTYKLLFTYDAAGRTASISNYSFNRPGDTATLVIEKFEYGADTLALRSTRVFRIFSPVATIRFDTIYLRHQNGALVGDSVRWQDVTSATTGVSVRRRSYRSGYIADTTYHVRISGGNADTTFETRRIWTNRVGPYFLHQLDSAEFRTASGMHFERFERTLDPTVIPNPIYAPMRVLGNPVFDAGATSFYGVFSTLQYVPAQEVYDSQTWMPGQAPQTIDSYTSRYTYTNRIDGYPIRIRAADAPGSGTAVQHTVLVYEQ